MGAHCASHSSISFTMSPISQSRSVTRAAIAGDMRTLLLMRANYTTPPPSYPAALAAGRQVDARRAKSGHAAWISSMSALRQKPPFGPVRLEPAGASILTAGEAELACEDE